MSRTIPSPSRSGRAKAASTTYVAPCLRCAGPKTSPGRLWAIIMWSRTVTEYISGLLRGRRVGVPDPVAEPGQLAGGDPGQHLRQFLERALAGDEHVEGRVGE